MADPRDHTIDYIEIPTPDVAASKSFFKTLFGWEFRDYGPDYVSFDDGRITGGFVESEKAPSVDTGSVLVVFYSENLDDVLDQVEGLDGTITKDIFEFPGGRRFHFRDPAGAEFAIWSDDRIEQSQDS